MMMMIVMMMTMTTAKILTCLLVHHILFSAIITLTIGPKYAGVPLAEAGIFSPEVHIILLGLLQAATRFSDCPACHVVQVVTLGNLTVAVLFVDGCLKVVFKRFLEMMSVSNRSKMEVQHHTNSKPTFTDKVIYTNRYIYPIFVN